MSSSRSQLVSVSNLRNLQRLLLLVLLFQLSTTCWCSPGRCRRGLRSAPAPTCPAMPAPLAMELGLPHSAQSDDHSKAFLRSSNAIRVDRSPSPALPLPDRQASLKEHLRRRRQNHRHEVDARHPRRCWDHPQAHPRPIGRFLMDTTTKPTRQRVWVTTAEACTALGMSRETLRQLRLRGVPTPGKHYRRWGCTQGRGPLQWHLENVEATITGWSRRHL